MRECRAMTAGMSDGVKSSSSMAMLFDFLVLGLVITPESRRGGDG